MLCSRCIQLGPRLAKSPLTREDRPEIRTTLRVVRVDRQRAADAELVAQLVTGQGVVATRI